MATLAELTQAFNGFGERDLCDNGTIISWLARALDWACRQTPVELPDRDRFAIRIGQAQEILPDPSLPAFPPSDHAGDQALADWLLIYGVSLLITDPAWRLLPAGYRYFVTCAKMYLGAPSSD